MRVLVVGNGGREHALAWKAAQSTHVEKVYVAPGNAGTAQEKKVENVAISPTQVSDLLQFAIDHHIDLTIVGPEIALAAGVVDAFQAAHKACFGPTQLAARLETSKAFSKAFMNRYHIPTARYATFTQLQEAEHYLKQQIYPVVIKADGLAAGKGVVIAENFNEACAAAAQMLQEQKFGNAGQCIVIEEFLVGEEASFIVIADGLTAVPLASSQDHKRLENGDQGPNTGGMGAYSPAPIVTDAITTQVMESVILPTLRGMAHEGNLYKGFLYAGLMISPSGEAKVLEFNCRLGDPETQPIMLRLKSDIVELCIAALSQRLYQTILDWDPRPSVGVVLANRGYPNTPVDGEKISSLPEETVDTKIFHAGTRQIDDSIITQGGRVLCVTSLGKTIQQARDEAYQMVAKVHWPSKYYRDDIAYRALRHMEIQEGSEIKDGN